MSKKLIGTTGLIVAVVLLIGINIIANNRIVGTRIDLTEGKLYTLADGSRKIAGSVKEPITLRFYFSRKLARSQATVADYARNVEELLGEFAAASNGKIKLEVIDPEPFSEAEENAVRAGLQGAPISPSERIYFGLQGINSLDGRKSIPFFMQDKERFLQYDIAQLIHDLDNPKKRRIAIVTNLPMQGGAPDQMAMFSGEEPEPAWVIYSELQKNYNVEVVAESAEALPAETDVLMVVHPKSLSDNLKKSIDQFVLGGGKALVFVDPVCDADRPPPNPQNPMQAMMAPKNSDLPELFKAWGVEMVAGKVVGDRTRAIEVQVGQRQRPEIVPAVLYMGLTAEDINRELPFSGQLEKVNVVLAGALKAVSGATTKFSPILQTTTDSELVDASSAQMFPDFKKMLTDFKPSGEKQTIAALITGPAKTAYPDEANAPAAEGAEKKEWLTESKEPINVAIFSDVDLLTDASWVQIQRIMNLQIPNVFASNGDLAVNMVDHLGGSTDLISIRGRGKFSRPFVVVEEMERKARAQASDKMKELEEKLTAAQTRLRELQQKAPEEGGAMIASSQLREEIEKARLEEVNTNRELRRLNLSLRRDVERLSSNIKIINIGLIPIFVGIVAVTLGTLKARRRRR